MKQRLLPTIAFVGSLFPYFYPSPTSLSVVCFFGVFLKIDFFFKVYVPLPLLMILKVTLLFQAIILFSFSDTFYQVFKMHYYYYYYYNKLLLLNGKNGCLSCISFVHWQPYIHIFLCLVHSHKTSQCA